jgi:hypothetical protein
MGLTDKSMNMPCSFPRRHSLPDLGTGPGEVLAHYFATNYGVTRECDAAHAEHEKIEKVTGSRDDKGEGDASMKSGCWIKGVFHQLGWAAGHDNSGRDDKFVLESMESQFIPS